MSNTMTKEAILIEATALATNEGLSANAKVELMSSLAVAAQAKTINETDAGAIFDAYLNAKQSTVNDKTQIVGNGKAGAKVTEGYARKTKSEWRQVIKCGAHPHVDGVEVLAVTRDVAQEKSIHVYDALIKISREQGKVKEQLTREQIEGLLSGEPSAKDNSEAKVLKDIAKALEKCISGIEATESSEGRPPYASKEASDALALINSRLAEITPKTEEAVKALIALGYSPKVARSMVR